MLDSSKYNKFREEVIKASNNSVEKLRYDLSMFMSDVKKTLLVFPTLQWIRISHFPKASLKDTYEHAFPDMPIEFSYPLDTKTTDGRNFNLYFFSNGEATSYVVSPDSLNDVMCGKFETAYDVGHITSDQIAYGIKYENNIYQEIVDKKDDIMAALEKTIDKAFMDEIANIKNTYNGMEIVEE